MISIVISYYRSLPNLRLILYALRKQSYMDFEVIVAEDDESNELPDFLTNHSSQFPFPMLHVSQPDLGFRKCRILNEAIRRSSSDFLVFIDGDCIPHRHFVKEYSKKAEEGAFFIGRRVMLDEKTSKKLLHHPHKSPPSFLSLIFSSSEKRKEAIYFPWFAIFLKQRGLKGANWGVMKQHLMEINGFDEDYEHAGVGEDVDIAWRLRGLGLHSKSMKNKAIVYHIFHHRSYSQEGVRNNYHILADKKATQGIICPNGLEKSNC